MSQAKLVHYDAENDILSIHKGFSPDERFKGNIDVGDLILDVSSRGRIRGIEIMSATSFFREFEIGEKLLKEVIDAEFNATIKPDSIIIGIVLKAKNGRKPLAAKIAVPLAGAAPRC